MPKGIQIEVQNDAEKTSHRAVRLAMSPSEFAGDQSQHRDTVRLLARMEGGGDTIVKIAVEYRKPGE